MTASDNTDNTSRINSKLEEFKRKHSDMEDELKRRLMMIKVKNLRLFLKQ